MKDLLVRLEDDNMPGSVLVVRETVRSCTPMASFILDRNTNFWLQSASLICQLLVSRWQAESGHTHQLRFDQVTHPSGTLKFGPKHRLLAAVSKHALGHQLGLSCFSVMSSSSWTKSSSCDCGQQA